MLKVGGVLRQYFEDLSLKNCNPPGLVVPNGCHACEAVCSFPFVQMDDNMCHIIFAVNTPWQHPLYLSSRVVLARFVCSRINSILMGFCIALILLEFEHVYIFSP